MKIVLAFSIILLAFGTSALDDARIQRNLRLVEKDGRERGGDGRSAARSQRARRFCNGDKFVMAPTPLYDDHEFSTEVAEVSFVNEYMYGPHKAQSTGSVVFPDGSMITYGGNFVPLTFNYRFAITGGTGEYLGASGELKYASEKTGLQTIEVKIL
ncbi:hypothetical protein THAOC_12352 [Thalassiosira oceanica]|uniref:Uncharacterized protein n=1 Tax=Thalassiosira oceanica TaxID=159749 RepID=K0T8E7_THAOC|nr:hypothetical protein THAOC_12352 [Thalassiosira oceanica]|eukprot:EJK66702.1 hypothetical protein THAOC_12352 [Thalassiosira oceanica]